MLESTSEEGGLEEMLHYTTVLGDRFRNVLGHAVEDQNHLLTFFSTRSSDASNTEETEKSLIDPDSSMEIAVSPPPSQSSYSIHRIVRSPSTKQSEHVLTELLMSEAQGGIRKQVPFADILLATTEIRPLDASHHFQVGLRLAKLCLYQLSQQHLTMASSPWDPAYHKLRATLSLPPVHTSLGSLATVINNFENQIEKYILSGTLKSSAITSSCESFDESSYVLAVLPLLHLMGYSAPRQEIVFGHSPVAMPVLLGEFYQAMCPPPKPFIPLPKVGPGEKIVGG